MIANDVVAKLADSKIVENVEAVNPGFFEYGFEQSISC